MEFDCWYGSDAHGPFQVERFHDVNLSGNQLPRISEELDVVNTL